MGYENWKGQTISESDSYHGTNSNNPWHYKPQNKCEKWTDCQKRQISTWTEEPWEKCVERLMSCNQVELKIIYFALIAIFRPPPTASTKQIVWHDWWWQSTIAFYARQEFTIASKFLLTKATITLNSSKYTQQQTNKKNWRDGKSADLARSNNRRQKLDWKKQK